MRNLGTIFHQEHSIFRNDNRRPEGLCRDPRIETASQNPRYIACVESVGQYRENNIPTTGAVTTGAPELCLDQQILQASAAASYWNCMGTVIPFLARENGRRPAQIYVDDRLRRLLRDHGNDGVACMEYWLRRPGEQQGQTGSSLCTQRRFFHGRRDLDADSPLQKDAGDSQSSRAD